MYSNLLPITTAINPRELGGLTDITAGEDIGKDVQIPSNHLLIIPRDDGRGVYCKTDAVFMIRGDYQIR